MSRRLRYLAIAEATTYLVLLATLVWRRRFGGPDLSDATGPVHGLVFVAYVAAVLIERADRGWRASKTFLALGAAVIPLGGYVAAHRLLASDGVPPEPPGAAS
jgi:integral membrane protein